MRRHPIPARAGRLLVPLAAAAAALAVGGCQTTSPIQTDRPYVPADGVPVDLGDVQIRNLVVIAEEEGGPGTISAAVANRGDRSTSVTFATEGGGTARAEVPAYGQEQVSGDSPVTLPQVTASPGGVVTLQVSASGAPSTVVEVPVLPPEGYYETLAPK